MERLALVVAAGVLLATAQVAAVTTISSLNPILRRKSSASPPTYNSRRRRVRTPRAPIHSDTQTPATCQGLRNVQTLGSTTALTTQASIVVSTLSAGPYVIQASFAGDNVYAKPGVDAPSIGITPTINEVVNGGSFLLGIQRGSGCRSSDPARVCRRSGREWTCRRDLERILTDLAQKG